MNRAILFRGKRTDTDEYEWVYGDLFHNIVFDGREHETRIGDIYFDQENRIEGTAVYNVIPETIGQFIGLTDRNGQMIFEGDIIKYRGEYGEISYSTAEARFVIEFNTWCTDFDHMYSREVEVIGNIHDNPELMLEESE